jgi:signal transduction histidine kinase
MPALFEPYSRANRSAGGGTGLGLYIARGIAKAHGGKIDVQSELGIGSTFSLILPIGKPLG